MKRTTYYGSAKKSKKSFIWIGVGIAVVIAIIIAMFFYWNQKNLHDNDAGQTPVEENKGEQENQPENNTQEQKTTEEPKENGEEQTEPQEPLTNGGYIEGQPLPSEPVYVEGVLIANKKYPLPSDFAPGESKEARSAFEKMAGDAKVAGFELVAFSTYRSFEYQQTLYNNYVDRDGQENADRYSARPGYSEHQTGLAFDIGEKGKEDLWLTEEFGETEAGKWLVENAHNYGFILRYPPGKENITGYMYESWHFRYLGVDLATKVKNAKVTLEEYLGIE
ncbi:D-alanyl-D-alanine carboxypeptidase family protein [Lysinibacillus yapensis]|uniref:D-alanyl-D-alanine carboxypeptidase family protein n=1 Tax=Ureibacillus yapensis TaxID=2304605 RepID=A0A396S548_9BACL|nr:M15 family metallopeptidase [Lysinibacillus yapensis]RHW34902.1 D-alanyl-D-alanine carboxypeptidase family protein [Lysinibacillus yapensis]